MIVKYLTTKYRDEIVRVECLSETDKTVMVQPSHGGLARPRRALKVSDYERYHDTWEAAHAYLTERAANKLRAARAAVAVAERSVATVAALQNSEVQP